MNKKILTATLIFLSLFSFLSFQENEAAIALEEVSNQFSNGLDELELAVEDLVFAAENLSEAASSKIALQEAIINTRLSYKKTEFLTAYFDPYNTKKNINGAPLLSVEPNVPEVVVIEPTGLQVLDEIIFTDEPFEEKEAIIELAKQFAKDYKTMRNYQSNISVEHRHVFEAMRQELVRIFTLGVTGFDTPGSANAIPEAKAALEGVYAALKSYMPIIEEKSRGLAIVMDARMEYTLNYLEKNSDFETFDRLEFLMQHIEPQYHELHTLHDQLGIEFYEEVDDRPIPVNHHAVSIFAPDFLNAGYFANLDMDHPLMEKRIELGKVLFFDPVLSSNLQRSCASCHQPEKAFTDGKKKSIATDFAGDVGRNSPTLVNSVYADKFFWDIREPRLDRQMLHVVKSDKEFATDYVDIIKKLNQSSAYKGQFAEAYPEHPQYQISTYTISDALSAYVASLNSFDSPFDQYVRGETGVIDPAVKRGFNLFMGKAACGTCHFAPVFNGTVPPLYDESESEVLGIPTTTDTLNPAQDPDLGRWSSGQPRDVTDFYKTSFKTVTVRNAALTAPYMHNGVHETLEQVVDFYNRGGGAGMGMDVPHQTLPFDNLSLTAAEQADLVAFMKALTGDMSKFDIPEKLPAFENNPEWNDRKIGGEY
ncbi:MAG: cytochrome c peroxidase [Bacteroidota bacterium]